MSITRFNNKAKVADITPNIDDILNAIYPIGVIVCGAKPAVGTWEKVEGKFLLGSSSSHAADSTGGEETHKLTTNEMPSHTHTPQLGNGYYVTIDDTSPNKYGIANGSFVQMSWGQTVVEPQAQQVAIQLTTTCHLIWPLICGGG